MRAPFACGWLLSRVGLCLLLLWVLPAEADDGRGAFSEGMNAARAGHHERALESFDQARRLGLDTPALHYNTGVSLYRLGRYAAAEQAFERAARDRELRALSYHNLGRIHLARGDGALAALWFERSLEASRTRELRQLNRRRLSALRGEGRVWDAFVEFGTGYDDNVLLATEQSASDTGDVFFSALLSGRWQMSGSQAEGVAGTGVVHLVRHPDLDEFDSTGMDADLTVGRVAGRWRTRLGGGVGVLGFGGERMESEARALATAQRVLTPALRLDLRYSFALVDGNDAAGFGFLDGYRHDARARLRGRAGALAWSAAWQAEYSNRDGVADGDDFSSYSPLRNRLAVTGLWPLSTELETEWSASYRDTRYQDDDIRDGGATRVSRHDRQLRLGAALYRQLDNDWRLGGRIVHTDNTSNIDEFEYSRWWFGLTLDRSF